MRVLLVGSGPLVYFLAREFIGRNHSVNIVSHEESAARALSRRLSISVLHGDGSDPKVLEEAGARLADAVLALTLHDYDNLAVCLIAKQIYGVPRTLVIVNDPENEEVFQQLGVTVALSATTVLARILEERMGFEDIDNLFAAADGRVIISEITLRPDAPAADRLLNSLELPEGALIGGIIRHDQVIVPRGASYLQPGDRLIVIAEPRSHADVLHLLTGEQP